MFTNVINTVRNRVSVIVHGWVCPGCGANNSDIAHSKCQFCGGN